MEKAIEIHPIADTERSMSNSVFPIGYVRSQYEACHDIPVERGVSKIRILDEYIPGLKGLTTASHAIVLGFFHLADRKDLTASPRPGARELHERGILSVRSPARPNPIGYTVVRLLAVDDGQLTVQGLDFVDGTPVIDIKPYSPGWDAIHCAKRVRRVPLHEMTPEKTLDLLLRDAVNFAAELDEEGFAVVAMMLLLATRYRIDPRDSSLRVELNRYGAPLDALIGMCGATFGSGRISILDSARAPLRCCFRWDDVAVTMKVKNERSGFGRLNPETAAVWVEVFEE
jgi:tRNA-Thr(GGU) m(6)t(6)A37 methyltransferase TsaA